LHRFRAAVQRTGPFAGARHGAASNQCTLHAAFFKPLRSSHSAVPTTTVQPLRERRRL